MSDRRSQNGFTLIEMLVALAIFSLAALALLRLQGGTLRSTAHLRDGIVAGIVARNVVVEASTDAAPPTLGRTSGVEASHFAAAARRSGGTCASRSSRTCRGSGRHAGD